MMAPQGEVRAECLTPVDLEAARAACPVVYLPLGSLEFHSSHLPIGLDALNAHGVCVAAAQTAGGIVLPPLYQGVGGGHSDYPWTIMMATDEGVRQHLEQTLTRLEQFGFTLAVLFTGHFADEQLAMIDDIAERWHNDSGRSLQVLATGVNRCADAPLAPNHAGIFETALLHSFRPDLVHLDRLPDLLEEPSVDPLGDTAGEHRHDPRHPLWGIFGPDPRTFDASQAPQLRDALVVWLTGLVNQATTSR